MMQATLVYFLDVGSQNPANLLTRAENVPVDEGELIFLGLDPAGSASVVDGTRIKRTINLKTNSQGDTMWQTPDQLKYGTRNLYKQKFEFLMPALVTAEEPVVTTI